MAETAGARDPGHSGGITVRRARRPSIRLVLTSLLAISAIASFARVSAAEPLRIVLLPVVVHSSESQDYLQAGLADMLSSRLQQVTALEVIELEDPEDATTRLETAMLRGRNAGGDFVLFGSFTRFGQGASLDMQCASTQGDLSQAPLREIFVHSGSIGDVIPDLDELVGKVTRFVMQEQGGGPIVAGGDAPPASVSSASGGGDAAVGELIRRIEVLEEALGIGPGASEAVPLPIPGT